MSGGDIIVEEEKKRLASLRQRVQSKLIESRMKSKRMEKKASEELVIKVQTDNEEDPIFENEDFEGDTSLSLASTLVLIGSIMGIISGVLILQGNPSELLDSSLFKDNDSLDIHGLVLDSEGDSMENVTIKLVDIDTGKSFKETKTDSNGRYIIENVVVKNYKLNISKEGYETVIVKFKPEPVGVSPVTMLVGDGERIKDELSETEGWSMENAVALATVEGLITIGCALVGVHASFEIKRRKKYRRTQIFCWVGLFSRGLIIFGPALILFSMILLMTNKQDFEDQRAVEAF